MSIQSAIETGDVSALRQTLKDSPAAANALIEWGPGGKNRTHPLHYVSDIACDNVITEERGLELIEALLEGGSEVNFKANETALHAAASLGTEDIGLRLLKAGADPNILGAFGETPLHWAAYCGLPRLAEGLLKARSRTDIIDTRYNATVLGWAEHGLRTRKPGSSAQHERVIELLS